MKRWIDRKSLLVGIGARDGLEARLIARAGFDFVWCSSLGVSAAHAVPDASLISMNQILETARFMRDAVDIPVVVDGDTGYGNGTNVAYAVRQFEAAGIAGVCFEDKAFPKENSLLREGHQDLAPMEEFAAKIRSAVAARIRKDFLIMGRVEALIAGCGQDEALRRAKAYEQAGADVILIHSRSHTPDEIETFINRWEGGIQLVLVPTNYPSLTEERITALKKVKMVIYSNQVLRAGILAQEHLLGEIRKAGGIQTIDSRMAPLKHVFELQGNLDPGKSPVKSPPSQETQSCSPSA